jgi:hypothetical protein
MATVKNVLKIPALAKLLSECWKDAEVNLQDNIQQHCPGIAEEAITQSFHAELSRTLSTASENRTIERAFQSDLKMSFLGRGHEFEFDPRLVARNLVADVTLHKRQTEAATGGDMGLLIIRPEVKLGNSSLRISDYRRGLLAQAKLKGDKGWGPFTKNQEEILPQRLDYLTLLLYGYEDHARRILRPFTWQLAQGLSFEALKNSLRTGTFHNTLDSAEIIRSLSEGRIGTAEDSTIDNVISPAGNPVLVLRVHWPKNAHPGSSVRVYSAQQTRKTIKAIARH